MTKEEKQNRIAELQEEVKVLFEKTKKSMLKLSVLKSEPYCPEEYQDFMHKKVLVTYDTIHGVTAKKAYFYGFIDDDTPVLYRMRADGTKSKIKERLIYNIIRMELC